MDELNPDDARTDSSIEYTVGDVKKLCCDVLSYAQVVIGLHAGLEFDRIEMDIGILCDGYFNLRNSLVTI